jgi:hypothetical protein
MKRTKLIYYNPQIVTGPANHDLPGMKNFSSFFKIFNPNVVCIDRTGTIRLPVSTHSLFPMPAFRKMSETLETICNKRATELLERAERLDMRLNVFWSGGIDSTLMLVSLLKNANADQRKRIVILMSEESIKEYPLFYEKHIRAQIQTDSSAMFPYLLGTQQLFVGAEHNDQLFGSDKVAALIAKFGNGIIHKPYDRDVFFSLFDATLNDAARTNLYLDLFERLKGASPVDIHSNYLFLWWINFSMKWQSVFMRMLAYTAERNASKLNLEYLKTNYSHFYNTDEFQLWSMNNLDKRIKDEWRTYKWPCKDIIYDYTKDAVYRDTKVKVGSLYFLLTERESFNFMDDEARLYKELDREAYYESSNDFA